VSKGFQPATGRDLRVGDFVRDELAQILQREMRDPRVGMVSVNEVRVSKDLSFADVYVSSLETDTQEQKDALIAALGNAAGWMRSELAKRHSMRTTPKLRFHYDDVVDRGPRLEALIEHAVASDKRQHARDEGPDHG
jgi:ribosome-binding factor A